MTYFCHHWSDNSVDLSYIMSTSDNDADLSDLYVNLPDGIPTCQIIVFWTICMAITGQEHVFKIDSLEKLCDNSA